MSQTKRSTRKVQKQTSLRELPDGIDLFSTKWDIVYIDTPYEVGDARSTTQPLFGECNLIDRRIEIYAGDRSIPDIWKTLIHEILHAIANELGMEELENLNSYEAVVDGLATGLVDMIYKNKLCILGGHKGK